MNTSAINSPLGIVPAAASSNAAAPSDAAAFNQVLSREIADRSSSSSEAAKNTQKNGSGSGEKTKDAKGDSAAPATSETTKEQDQATAITAGKKDELDAEPVTASAELLAFVASLTQANTAAAPVATSDTPLATTATAKISDIDSALDTTLGAATTAADSEKDALGKKSDFVAALDKATTGDKGKTASNTPAATVPVKVDVELVAAVVKGIEPASVSNPQAVAVLNSAALQQLNNAQAAQSAKLAPQVGSPGWDQALGQKVVWMVQGAQQSATLTLNPPDLGPLQVTLNVSNNQATANFTAHQPEVRHALEAAMPRLREMLNDAGIQLGQSSVSAGSPNQQNAFSEQRQNGRQASHSGATAEPVIHVSHVPLPSSGSGIVDTFA